MGNKAQENSKNNKIKQYIMAKQIHVHTQEYKTIQHCKEKVCGHTM